MRTIEDSILRVIERVLCSRRIPKYQFERASEPFLSLFIEEALQTLKKTNIKFIVPEFPLKKADNAQSTNADYLFKT